MLVQARKPLCEAVPCIFHEARGTLRRLKKSSNNSFATYFAKVKTTSEQIYEKNYPKKRGAKKKKKRK